MIPKILILKKIILNICLNQPIIGLFHFIIALIISPYHQFRLPNHQFSLATINFTPTALLFTNFINFAPDHLFYLPLNLLVPSTITEFFDFLSKFSSFLITNPY